MSRGVQFNIYLTMVKPGVVFESETWAVTEMDMKRVGTWETRILRRIHGPVVEKGTCRIRTTSTVPKVMSNFFFFACELGTADEGEFSDRWNQLLCYP